MEQNQYMLVVQQKLQEEFEMEPHVDKLDFVNHLALEINRLITADFAKLVRILYRLDIDEKNLKEMLQKYVYEDAGYIIAQLIIKRELQKAEQRQKSAPDSSISPEDKW